MDLAEVSHSDDSVVKDGRIITSRGPGAAMNFALELLEALVGIQKRDEVKYKLARP